MAIISTFELLAKPQLPSGIPGPIASLSRNVIIGYFLTISNTSLTDLLLSVVFTARTNSGSGLEGSISFLDTSGTNIAGALEPTSTANKFRFSPLSLPASATAQLLVQPTPDKVETLDYEVRGYVELSLSSLSGSLTNIPLQVSAEQRGTFFADLKGATLADKALDQVAWALPVPDGGRVLLSST
ncbi:MULTISPECIES: hypothetical protein [Cyanophyceae]|jgi:hypothetical protein|uniref:DUF11 domain-containing protein n=1 Tax=Aphanothece cf. minutissima CCALA 015 TaxID=2107695 RepID=A0ABX5FBR0_9CHRO|nr:MULTISPECIES: hypothetical protein [Cyanophyceae]MCP9933576.1 hypothetical protein [Cyanobium sp. Candia 9D4]PSB39354.1 hypothetical protein C7B81_01525 [Aphanothece cf. minutissima CCALA 015]